MPQIESLIQGSEKLTNIFGYWPSFHDAVVIELHFWRGDIDEDKDRYVFPVLTVKFHVWELTSEVNERGGLVLRLHTLTTLRFHDVSEFKMDGFNHINDIIALRIEQQERAEGPSPFFSVQFVRGCGISASFRCFQVEVVDAVPCTEEGEV